MIGGEWRPGALANSCCGWYRDVGPNLQWPGFAPFGRESRSITTYSMLGHDFIDTNPDTGQESVSMKYKTQYICGPCRGG